MLVDRDRLSDLENMEEIAEIIRIWGWAKMIDYLKQVGTSKYYDKELHEAFEAIRPIAAAACDRIIANVNGVGSAAARPAKKKVKLKTRCGKPR